MVKKGLFILFFIIICKITFSQTDTEFWFVAPEVTAGHGDNPIYLRITSFGAASTVTINQPANPLFPDTILNVPANGTSTLDLTPWKNRYIENYAFTDSANFTYVDLKKNNFGIHIVSTNPITAYYEVARTNNPDIFTLKGRNALGNEFFIPAQNYIDNRWSLTPDARSGFDIVATEDNTTITIYPTKSIEVNRTTPYTITLNRGQTYSATASSRLAVNHLYGTRVVSDKPIAITIKDDSVYGNACYDLMGDQIVPTNLLGTDYIAIKGSLTAQEGICVIAPYNNTEIYINGNAVPVATINSTGIYKFTIPGVAGTSTYIRTSKPAYVLQITGFGCETGQALLPPVACTGSSKVAFMRTTNENFGLIIFTEDAAKGDFTLVSNGVTTNLNPASFTAVPGYPGFVAAKIDFNTTEVQVNFQTTLSNPTALFHCGVINGGTNTGCRYGYFSNYNPLDLGSNDFLFNGCGYNLDAGDWDSYLWNTGETTQTITAQDSGWYWVQVQKGSCDKIDSIYIAYTPPITLGSDTSICYGDSLILDIGTGYSFYQWSTGQSGATLNSITVAGGTYSVTVTDNYGCTSSASIRIIQNPELTLSSSASNIKCIGNTDGSINLTVSGGSPPYQYSWSNSAIIEDISFLSSGNYTVTVNDAIGCSKTLTSTVNSPLAITGLIVPINVSCYESTNGSIDLTVNGGTSPYSYIWSNGATTQDISGLNSGSYFVTITDINLCQLTLSERIAKPSSPLSAFIIGNNVSCKVGNNGSTNVTVNGGTSPYTYLWSNLASSQNISNLSAGIYSVTVTDSNLCTTVSSITITEPSNILSSTITGTPALCYGELSGTIDLSVSGGTPEYSYLWNIGQITEDINGVGAGTYSVTITDANLCTTTNSVTITQPSEIIATANVNNISCYGASNGSISLIVSGGNPLYTFLWSNGQTSSSVFGLIAGEYQVIIKDSSMCISISNITVN